MTTIQLISLACIVFGALFMLLGILKTRTVIPLLLTDRQRRRWKMLWGMMAFFLLGYVVTAYVVAKPMLTILAPLTAAVFLVGAMFVLQVVRVGFDTVKDLRDLVAQRTVNLEEALAELEKNNEARQKLNEELSTSLKLKDQFLSSVSHELRTPLSGILGMSEALNLELYGNLEERQKKAVTTIENCGQQLLELINSILEFTKLESGNVLFEPRKVDLNTQVNLVLKGIESKMSARSIRCESLRLDEAVEVEVDPRGFQQILQHIINNAIKFSEEGSEIGLRYRDCPEDETFDITVWDQGIGISETKKAMLFEAFVQGDGGLNRQHEGTGLGLAIALLLVRLHHGKIGVESTEGEGSEFTVTLPTVQNKGLTRVGSD